MTHFVRDRFTWFTYIALAYVIYVQSAVAGPIMPFLREELNLSYTIGGLHITSLALSGLIIGLIGDGYVQRFGRKRILWLAALGMAMAATLIMVGRSPIVTISGTALIGLSFVNMMIVVQSALADHHSQHRNVALTEANTFAMISAVFSPLMVGWLESIGVGWRGALMIALVAFVVLLMTFYRMPIPEIKKRPKKQSTSSDDALPPIYWAYWLVLAVGIGVEWGVSVWAADFLHTEVGVTKELGASLITVFFLAMVMGRGIGSILARRISMSRLLIMTAVVTLVGFPLFWLSPFAPLNILGLFIVGLGAANFFPFAMAAAIEAVPDKPDLVNARMASSGSLALLIVPQVLGFTADQVGIKGAYGIVLVLILVLIATSIMAYRMANQHVYAPV